MGRSRSSKKRKQQAAEQGSAAAEVDAPPLAPPPLSKGNGKKRAREQACSAPPPAKQAKQAKPASKLSALQAKMRSKLDGARFRQLNEQLYTTRGEDAFASFSAEPHLFDVYHRGFREQVERWPVNPLDEIVTWLRRKHKRAVVADFGCGDAQLALLVPNRVHSFDLVSTNDRVVACDMASVPLPDRSVDVAVFCLSLMGTNLSDYVREARRVLKPHGVMKVAEVRSRFEGGGEEQVGGLAAFVAAVRRLGFDKVSSQVDNRMFAMFEFKVADRAPEAHVHIAAKPCVYKKR